MKLSCSFAVTFTSLICFSDICGQSTERDTNILSRKKRYLTFPKGANFVFQMVFVKPIMKTVPKGVQYLTECDVPFPLPSDTRLLRQFKHGHRVQKRQLLENIAISLDGYGLNGTSCVKSIICDAQEFIPFRGKSLVKDLILAIFSNPDTDPEAEADLFSESCQRSIASECPQPLLDLIWRSLTNY